MKKIKIVTIVLCIIMIFSACGDSGMTSKKAEELSFKVPSDWIEDYEDYEVLNEKAWYYVMHSPSSFSIIIKTTDEYIDDLMLEEEAVPKDIELLSDVEKSIVDIDGARAFFFKYSGKYDFSDNNTDFQVYSFELSDSKICTISLTTVEDDTEKYQSDFEKIMKTVKIDK